ncbi:uncharacterized protein LOC141628895 [Silene latifolia]|uniref:uncharacterized protein LOC141628895 n=1 Tax=Silene latifolia TaxID=37657 RepID=UPI003D775B8E
MYNRKSCSPRVLMKLDLQKAYDSIEWTFVSDMLEATGFPKKFIVLLLQRVTTPSYSLSLNGEYFGHHPLCKRINLTHLCFADDLIMFCKDERASIDLLLKAFNYFSEATGLVMNSGKSNFYANGVLDSLIREIEQATGM